MRRICLTLPTNRACSVTLKAVAEEAAYAAKNFDVEVVLLVLDSSSEQHRAEHAELLAGLPKTPGVVPLHMDEAEQRVFLQQSIELADLAKPDLVLDLMLPDAVSYGACTNRAFLIASALGCDSVHRRDSDLHYQVKDGEQAFPIHHELTSIGKRAGDAKPGVSAVALDESDEDKPVVLVGGSFIGDLSVDISEIQELDPALYHDVVSLWAHSGATEAEKRDLVEESFKGAGTEPFTEDHSIITIVDPMRIDMSNIAFHRVQEQVPLPPARDTIGSDYFHFHLIHDSRLPGVLHNRHIVNFHTGERKTDAGFAAYQLRFAKFFLSMLYFHHIYQRMAELGQSLLDERYDVKASVIADLARESTSLAKDENTARLDTIDRAYRELGGRYATFAESLVPQRDRLLADAQQDIEDFALLIEVWAPLVRASESTDLANAWR
ncbi:DUF6271 family protein [Kibdelosporangium philippinense]|uniref:DUF6271 family protein n=1 Tax=Kibdelosporangium philippinense TaxID=211113 RepID=A0ABS8Z8Q9_9PSEU|nr:DUF6271 family protein [Kibdelosporangium philippinense]MCE7004261.1 DUF6271 family protein [Kibdelosporangium philippinense]